jgi:hypothetical protein
VALDVAKGECVVAGGLLVDIRREGGNEVVGRMPVGQGERTRLLGLTKSPVSRLLHSCRHGLRGGLLRLPSTIPLISNDFKRRKR